MTVFYEHRFNANVIDRYAHRPMLCQNQVTFGLGGGLVLDQTQWHIAQPANSVSIQKEKQFQFKESAYVLGTARENICLLKEMSS